jgi:oxygen-independent coproporphyrinogen-3 oxidase
MAVVSSSGPVAARDTDPRADSRAPAVGSPQTTGAGLYLHVPFCRSLCGYCAFARGLFAGDLKDRYVAAIEREIHRAGESGGADAVRADTVYLGGGTPSLLCAAEVARLLSACRDTFDLDPHAEVTLEANPESVDPETLAGFRGAGVTRLSIGAQSFHDTELALLGRIHTAAEARRAVEQAARAGFDSVGVDLMMGLPGQSLADWLASVDALAALAPAHASLYVLEIHPGDRLPIEMARRGLAAAGDDLVADMYLAAMERLEGSGYRQYEISNLARAGFESRHNTKYWTDGDWIGFGSAAHSARGGVRWRNVADAGDYIARVDGAGPVAERQLPSARRRLEDALFMGLRRADGVDTEALGCRYGIDVWEAYGRRLAPFVEAGVLVREAGILRLTRRGMLLSNEVMLSFV